MYATERSGLSTAQGKMEVPEGNGDNSVILTRRKDGKLMTVHTCLGEHYLGR